MSNHIINQIIPENLTGKAVDLEETVTEANTDDATATFTRACKRLQNPRVWQQVSGGKLSAAFELVTDNNTDPHRLVQQNDYLKIDIPGPGSPAGEGYDWVQVKAVAADADEDADESFGITVASAPNPQKPEDGVAHFFKEGASSSFIIRRKGNTVSATYHGRNEIPNTKDGSITCKLRNTAVAAGAMAGLSELQWTALIKGFLQKEIGGQE